MSFFISYLCGIFHNHLFLCNASIFISVHKLCVNYETDNRPSAESAFGNEFKLKINNSESEILLVIKKFKLKGNNATECIDFNSPYSPDNLTTQSVQITQSKGGDGWAVKSLKIETYPGSEYYNGYSLDPYNSKFWLEGVNTTCRNNIASDGLPCCPNNEWCDLMVYGKYCDRLRRYSFLV